MSGVTFQATLLINLNLYCVCMLLLLFIKFEMMPRPFVRVLIFSTDVIEMKVGRRETSSEWVGRWAYLLRFPTAADSAVVAATGAGANVPVLRVIADVGIPPERNDISILELIVR